MTKSNLDGWVNRVTIGAGTYVNRVTMFDVSDEIEVGRKCLVGLFCYITDHDHGGGFACANKCWSAAPLYRDEVWIGAPAILPKGGRVGHGELIGAGSNAKVADVPAREIGVPVVPSAQ